MEQDVSLFTGGVSMIISMAVFVLAVVLITTEKLPNAIVSMFGAFLLVAFHIMSQSEAISYIDFDTIGLLCGMMLIVAVMRKTGIFEYIAIKSIKYTRGRPWRILVVLSFVTAILSAFLDNVTTVLIIVPLTFAVSDSLQINPLPLLISETLFSNIGGAGTLIGDPPNIMIGGATHLDFMDFIVINMPIVVVVGVVTFLILRLIYYKKLESCIIDSDRINSFDETRIIEDKKFLIKNLVVFTLVIVAFTTHHIHEISLGSVALGGGFLLMMVTRQSPEEVLKEVEWPTLFFFIGLFIIIGGLEKTGVISNLADRLWAFTGGELMKTSQLILWMSAFSTTFVNSIPYTATMISIIHKMAASASGDVDVLWWALSLGACLGGNGTIIGAAANIIVAGFAQKTKTPLSFLEYFKIGFPLMLVSIAIASVYLFIRF